MLLPAIPEYFRAPLAFVVSLSAAIVLLPVAVRVARALGAVDLPGGRRLHTLPVPRLGGAAVIIAAAMACVVVFAGSGVHAGRLLTPAVVTAFIGGGIVFLVGLLDDLYGLPPFTKLLAQTVAAVLVVSTGP
ncbi:MAG: hypothetical protein ABIW79_06980, partial [Gemmatimonas sp.]